MSAKAKAKEILKSDLDLADLALDLDIDDSWKGRMEVIALAILRTLLKVKEK